MNDSNQYRAGAEGQQPAIPGRDDQLLPFSPFLKLFPQEEIKKSAATLVSRGTQLLKMGHWEEAQRIFGQYLESYPESLIGQMGEFCALRHFATPRQCIEDLIKTYEQASMEQTLRLDPWIHWEKAGGPLPVDQAGWMLRKAFAADFRYQPLKWEELACFPLLELEALIPLRDAFDSDLFREIYFYPLVRSLETCERKLFRMGVAWLEDQLKRQNLEIEDLNTRLPEIERLHEQADAVRARYNAKLDQCEEPFHELHDDIRAEVERRAERIEGMVRDHRERKILHERFFCWVNTKWRWDTTWMANSGILFFTLGIPCAFYWYKLVHQHLVFRASPANWFVDIIRSLLLGFCTTWLLYIFVYLILYLATRPMKRELQKLEAQYSELKESSEQYTQALFNIANARWMETWLRRLCKGLFDSRLAFICAQKEELTHLEELKQRLESRQAYQHKLEQVLTTIHQAKGAHSPQSPLFDSTDEF